MGATHSATLITCPEQLSTSGPYVWCPAAIIIKHVMEKPDEEMEAQRVQAACTSAQMLSGRAGV